MTVSPLSLLDLISQNTATPVTATAGDWQHFQDLLKSAVDQNAGGEATKPVVAERAVTRAGFAQPAEAEAAQARSSTDAQVSAARVDARRDIATQNEAAQADADQAKSAAARRVEKRNAARADAAADDQTATAAPDAANAPSEPAAAAATTNGAAADATATSSAPQTASGAAGQDGASPPDPGNGAPSATDSGVAATAIAADPPIDLPQTASSSAPQPPQSRASTGARKDATQGAAIDSTTADPGATVPAAADSGPILAVAAAPLPPVPVSIAAGATQSTVASASQTTTGSLADLLSSTGDATIGDHLAVGVAAPGARSAKPADAATADPAAALFGAGGDAAASLAAGLAPAPGAQGGNTSSGQGSGQKPGNSAAAATATAEHSARSDDSQVAPAAPQVAAQPPSLGQPVVAPEITLGAGLVSAGLPRAATATAADAGVDPDGTTTPLGFADRTAATSLSPLRLSETPSSAASPYAPTQAPLPVEQVALAIGRLTNGARSFSMQLNPEHLGAVDVRMEVDAKGKTKVAITAERPETLALLKLDSHHLVKALQESGVSADQASLSFSLREQGSNAAGDRRSGSGQGGRSTAQLSTDDTQDPEAVTVRMSLSRHLYDIHA